MQLNKWRWPKVTLAAENFNQNQTCVDSEIRHIHGGKILAQFITS